MRCSVARRVASALAWASLASRTFGDAGIWTRGRAGPAVCAAAGRAARLAVAIARTAASAAPEVALPTIVCILADSQT